MSDRARFAVAFGAGIALAFLGLVGGLIVMAAMLFAALLTWSTFGRVAFAGITLALGLTWTTIFILAAWDCGPPAQRCGATPPDMTPHIAISIGLAVLGGGALLLGRGTPNRGRAG